MKNLLFILTIILLSSCGKEDIKPDDFLTHQGTIQTYEKEVLRYEIYNHELSQEELKEWESFGNNLPNVLCFAPNISLLQCWEGSAELRLKEIVNNFDSNVQVHLKFKIQ